MAKTLISIVKELTVKAAIYNVLINLRDEKPRTARQEKKVMTQEKKVMT